MSDNTKSLIGSLRTFHSCRAGQFLGDTSHQMDLVSPLPEPQLGMVLTRKRSQETREERTLFTNTLQHPTPRCLLSLSFSPRQSSSLSMVRGTGLTSTSTLQSPQYVLTSTYYMFHAVIGYQYRKRKLKSKSESNSESKQQQQNSKSHSNPQPKPGNQAVHK